MVRLGCVEDESKSWNPPAGSPACQAVPRRSLRLRQRRDNPMKKNLLLIVAAICLLAAASVFLASTISARSAANRDFIEYWAAGQQLVHGGNPYDSAAILRIERAAGFEHDLPEISLSPPVALFLTMPLGHLDEKAALALWSMAQLLSLVASVRMLRALHGNPANRLHLVAYLFAPVLTCLMAGQISLFLLLGIVVFLHIHPTRPFLSGAALLPWTLKPHLFLPFAIALAFWAIYRKRYRVLAGLATAFFACCAVSIYCDPNVWAQYSQMVRETAVTDAFVPTLSVLLRTLVDRHAVWLQFIPEAAACLWTLWYFWTRRDRWNWMRHGMLVLLVAAVCTPYGWFFDEAALLPALLAALYLAVESRLTILLYGMIAGAALLEVALGFPVTSPLYLWTAPAWLAWYLYATRRKAARILAAA
jgi:hypothetical protein